MGPFEEIRRDGEGNWLARVAGQTLVLLLSLTLIAACAPTKPKATFSATDPAGRQACLQVEQQWETAIQQYELDHPRFRPQLTIDGLAAATGVKRPWCPAGGDYSWDPTTQEINCSIHGHY